MTSVVLVTNERDDKWEGNKVGKSPNHRHAQMEGSIFWLILQ